MSEMKDVRYAVENGLAWIIIDRPERLNAIRARTVDELIACLKRAWVDEVVHAVAITGAGDRAFCVGGDQKQRVETGDFGPSATGLFEIETLFRVIRDIPKPVIAAVNGYAMGGGHVLHVVCDLTIASENAVFAQNDPRVGSFGAFGSAYLARLIGEKRSREIWFLSRKYDAQTALRWGLVNAVVPADRLCDEVRAWAAEIQEVSPTALKFVKHELNADTESIAGIGRLGFSILEGFMSSAEGMSLAEAFVDRSSTESERDGS